MDEHATGAWLHLRHDTSRETTLYACNEGVAFSVADAVESLFTGLQLPPGTEIRCSGGGTRMPNYLQLLCDTLGQPLTVLPSSDSTALGAAILAGVASRTYAGLQPAVQALGLTAGESRHPNPERHSALARRREHRNRLRDEYLSWPLE